MKSDIFAPLMEIGKVISESRHFGLMVDRLCLQLIEQYGVLSELCLVGIQERGVLLADRLMERLKVLHTPEDLPKYGKLDITFYRDDYRQREKPLKASRTEMNFLVDGSTVVLVDDVLYTGRTIHAALTALNDFGRPSRVDLLTLVDRRFNRELPISANYIGMVVDALDQAYVKVEWEDFNGQDRILLFDAKSQMIQ